MKHNLNLEDYISTISSLDLISCEVTGVKSLIWVKLLLYIVVLVQVELSVQL